MADHVGGLLIRAGLITQNQLLAALSARRRFGGTLAEHLIVSRAVDEVRLAEFYRDRLLVPAIIRDDLARARPQVLQRVTARMAEEFRVVPVALDREGSLVLAMVDPSDTHVADEVGFFAQTSIVRAVATYADIRWALDKHYQIQLAPPGKQAPGKADSPRTQTGSISPAPKRIEPAVIVDDDWPAADAIPLTRRKPTGEILPEEPVIALGAPKQPPPAYIPDEITLKFRPKPEPPPAEPVEHSVIVTLDPDELAPIEGVLGELAAAADTAGVSRVLLDYLSARCRRAVLFQVESGVLRAREAIGTGIRRRDLDAARLELDVPSLFRSIIGARLPYRGPIADPPSRDFLIDALGYAPTEALAIPIAVRDKVVGLVYGDEVHTAIPDPALAILAQRASTAFERLVQSHR